MMKLFTAILPIIAACLLPVTASAQTTSKPALVDGPAPGTVLTGPSRTERAYNYTLVQLTVKSDKVDGEAFRIASDAFQSCDDAKQWGKANGARIIKNQTVYSNNLPDRINEGLEKLSVGQASPVFNVGNSSMGVLVICRRKQV